MRPAFFLIPDVPCIANKPAICQPESFTSSIVKIARKFSLEFNHGFI